MNANEPIDPEDDVATLVDNFSSQLADPTEAFSLIVGFLSKPGAESHVIAAFARVRPATLSESGCRNFELNQVARDPSRFSVYEQWCSMSDFEAHLRTDYIARLRVELNELIAGTPEFHVLVPAGC